jgi:hypothetical protein
MSHAPKNWTEWQVSILDSTLIEDAEGTKEPTVWNCPFGGVDVRRDRLGRRGRGRSRRLLRPRWQYRTRRIFVPVEDVELPTRLLPQYQLPLNSFVSATTAPEDIRLWLSQPVSTLNNYIHMIASFYFYMDHYVRILDHEHPPLW